MGQKLYHIVAGALKIGVHKGPELMKNNRIIGRDTFHEMGTAKLKGRKNGATFGNPGIF
jgi:hypothetical protein